jgi:hypothetical protein
VQVATLSMTGQTDVGEDMSAHTWQDSGTLRVTIRAATHRLGVTEAAIRKRIQLGSLDKGMGGGRVYLDLSRNRPQPELQVYREAQVHLDELIEELWDRAAIVRSYLYRRRGLRQGSLQTRLLYSPMCVGGCGKSLAPRKKRRGSGEAHTREPAPSHRIVYPDALPFTLRGGGPVSASGVGPAVSL